MRKLSIIILALSAPLAQAQDPAQDPVPAHGAETRALLELQISGAASVATPAPMSGDVADAVYQRYLKSFSHEIPEQFEREKFVDSGGGGSSK